MKFETAVKRLQEEHEKAKSLEVVRDPVAYALYQVLKMTYAGGAKMDKEDDDV